MLMAFSTKSTEEVLLQKHYADLVHLLSRCIDDLLLRLVSNGVIDIYQKNVIRKYGDTPGDKVQYLLDNHVVRPLSVGINDSFVKLLSVMKEFPSCCQLVAAMEGGGVLQKENGSAESENSSDHEEEKLNDEIVEQQKDPNGQVEDVISNGEESNEQSPEVLTLDQPTSPIRDYAVINEQDVAMVIDQSGPSGGELSSPQMLAKGPNNGLICHNTTNQKLILFDEHLQYSRVIGEKGNGNGKFEDISGIVASETFLYVADSGLNCIQKFELAGKFVCQIGSEGEKTGQFNGPCGLLLSQLELLFVCDKYNHRIQVFQDDEFSYSFGHPGTGPGAFSRPIDLTMNNQEDQLFVTDSENNRLQVFTPKGDFIKVFGNFTDIPFELQMPFGTSFTADGHILISAVGTHCILVFKEDGTFVSAIEGTHQGKTRFSYPCGVVMMNSGQIVVADYYGNRLVVL